MKLIIEVDGAGHFTEEGEQHDRRRDQYLRKLGYEVVRIPGFDVLREPGSVRQQIESAIIARRGG